MKVCMLKRIGSQVALWSVIFAQITFFPLPIAAQTYNGGNTPTGSDSHTFVLNAETGLYENPYYTFNPNNGTRTATYDDTYKLNASTGLLEATHWYFSPGQGKFVQTTLTKPNPNPPAVEPTPAATTAPTSTVANTGSGSTNSIGSTGQTGSGGTNASISNTGSDSNNAISSNGTNLNAGIDTTGPNSNNTINSTNNSSATLNNNLDASITQNVDSLAVSGNAGVLQNTNGGSALSGDATTMATIINILQSSWGMSPSEIATFIANIDGDVFGDLTVDPGQLNNRQLAAGNAQPIDNLTVNNAVNGQINNNVDLLSASGSATVSGNTNAGSATSGDASAIVNILNLINSAITAGQSFVGQININGSLEGDILLPAWMQSQLIAAGNSGAFSGNTASVTNTGPNSNNTIDSTRDNSFTGNFEDNIAINNNIVSTALSGNAAVSGNTSGGSATTGSAESNVNILNLTGRQVVGANSLLVFVNVLGNWVGLILDAPAGSTSAAIGSGLSQNSQLPANNTEINSTTNAEINNNINVAAISGDANVTGNTNAGNATSGNALTGVNLANIANSQFSLSDWFGVLFINVFGRWRGSFGVDTAAGGFSTATDSTPPQNSGQTGGSGSGGQVASESSNSQSAPIAQVFGFTPRVASANTSTSPSPVSTGVSTGEQPAVQSVNTPKMSSTSVENIATTTSLDPGTSDENEQLAASRSWVVPLSFAILLFGAAIVGQRRTNAIQK